MDSNNFDDKIEELDENPSTTQEISDTEMPEEYLDENYEESYSDSNNRPKFGEREFKNAKDENGHHDKDYYKKRGQELDEKVNEAREEKNRDWKTEKKDDDQNKVNESADKNQNKENIDDTNKTDENKNSETKEKDNLKHKPEEERQNKNKFDKLKDNINLERAKNARWQNRLDGIKAKTYQTMHPVEAAKEEVKDKIKDEGKKVGKAAVKGAANVAKATGRLVAAGGKAVIGFLASNPIVLAILAGALILFIIIFMLFSKPSDEDTETLGYFDTTCDFNLTTVVYACPPYEDNNEEMSLKDYVLGVAYGESEERNFSEAAIKALMIIVRTNALAEGNYDSSGNKTIKINNCDVIYKDAYEELAEEENQAKKDKLKILGQYYNEIENFLFLSESYRSEITNLGKEDALEYNDEIIKQLSDTDKNSYEEILQELYANDESDEENIVNSKPSIFIGDSRTVGMNNVVSDLSDSDIVAKESIGYDWFINSGISLVNDKLKNSNESFNIISWLGVNDLNNVDNYFNKYKELAEGDWKNHTIYIVSVGPLNNGIDKNGKDNNDLVEVFNEQMSKKISDANISNLKYLDLGLTKENMDWEGCNDGVHYGNAAYQNIYEKIISKTNKINSKTKALYNNSEYCTYYHFNSGGCEVGWWWPIGQSGSYSKGAILREDPEIVSIGSGPDWGNRFHPVEMVWKYHNGEDLRSSLGRNVVASRSGTIITANDGNIDHAGEGDGGCGNEVVIDHGDGFFTRYCHLKQGSVSKYSSVGMKVSQGQIIALSGNSGTTTGPHLHFEIREGSANGTSYNPLNYISVDNPRPTGNCRNIGDYTNDAPGLCKALKDQDFPDNATAGILSNFGSESSFATNNLEGCYEKGRCCPAFGAHYGYCGTGYLIGDYGSDEAYTAGIDNGTYKNFAIDRAGYGIAQWTSQEEKQRLLDYYNMMKASNPNVSIADVGIQMGFLVQEMNSGKFPKVHNTIYNNGSASQVAYDFCMYYEIPANRYTQCAKRAANTSYYERLVANNCVEGE